MILLVPPSFDSESLLTITLTKAGAVPAGSAHRINDFCGHGGPPIGRLARIHKALRAFYPVAFEGERMRERWKKTGAGGGS